MKVTPILLGLLITSHVVSQKKEILFGEISNEELELSSYQKDPDAKAVILYDKGHSFFYDTDRGYNIRFTRHKRIKIFDKTESQHAEISIPYYVDGYGKTERVVSIVAATYNSEDGKITKKMVDPSSIYEERINSRWYNKKFVFPDVRNGSVLEYQYVLETPFHFNLPDWTFQDKIPTIYSEYQVNMIPFYEYVFLVQGITEFDFQESEVSKIQRSWSGLVEFYDYVHTYVLKDIPAFKDESYISSINDHIIKMDFQLAKFYSPRGGRTNIISSWTELNESLLKHEKFGKYIKGCSKFAKEVLSTELNISSISSRQKAKMIIDYVKTNFEWNGYYGKYASQSPKALFTKKSGNAADINLFMISMLMEAEIEVEPLILSTRDHGKIPSEYPFDHFTNYVIALVNPETPFLADGTEELLPYNKLPTRCNNEKGLVVSKEDTPKWINLHHSIPSIEKSIITMTLDTTSSDIIAQVSIQNTEYESFAARKKFENDSARISEFYATKIGNIKRSKTYGYDRVNLPYGMNFKTDYETEKVGNNIVIQPFLDLPLSKNRLVQEERSYPVDFIYPWENQFQSTLRIPDGFSLTELPEGFNLDNELAQISLTYSFENTVLSVEGNYKFRKSTYVAKEYAQIKHYLDQIVKYFNQPIILEKTY